MELSLVHELTELSQVPSGFRLDGNFLYDHRLCNASHCSNLLVAAVDVYASIDWSTLWFGSSHNDVGDILDDWTVWQRLVG